MNKQCLSTEQIDDLFEFFNLNSIQYYDVQIELVDHFALAIEAEWIIQPDISFLKALKIVTEKFGGQQGLITIKKEKEKELRRKYSLLQLKYVLAFFRLPKIIITLALTLVIYTFYSFFTNGEMVCYTINAILVIYFVIYPEVIIKQKFIFEIKPDKSFLLYEQFQNLRSTIFSFFLVAPILVLIFGKVSSFKFESPFFNYINLDLLTAFLNSLCVIMAIVVFDFTPRRIKEDFTREYPQFVKS